MSRVTPVQESFNGGEISRRLRGRIDQALRKISLAEMVGFAPLVEGPAEAMPGLLHVAQAPGPFRPFRFEYNTTQGHVLEFSAGKVRIYTNDVLLHDGGVPVEVASPYDWTAVQALSTHQSYDVLYCFHPGMQTRQFYRDGATSFGFDLLDLANGPFEDRNSDQGQRVSVSGVSGAVQVTATAALFEEGDVGGLFSIEVENFGDTPAWEPGITVTAGTLRTSLERVYRAVTAGRTGTWQPAHTEGVEWDGMASGTDLNDKDAGGVQWEYVHDKYGILRFTAFTDAQTMAAEVLRTLPFSTASGSYDYEGGYYDPEWGDYVPGGVAYSYGTWRWRFGAFSDRRGWPEGGCIWNERLCLRKGSTIYASAAADLTNYAELNELGEQSNDMGFTVTLADPNAIVDMAPDERLLAFTAGGCWAIGPGNAAQGVGPKNVRADRQHHSGSKRIDHVSLDGRALTISRCGTRIYQTDYDPGRQLESVEDLTRYARHIGKPGFTSIAQQRHPLNHVWVCRGDGSLACAAYLPEEQVLGFAARPLADGLLARYVVSITDPDGKFEQVWVAATFAGNWHMLRMAPWREDGDSDDTGCMLDMAGEYEGAAATEFTAPVLAGRDLQVVADGEYVEVTAAAITGAFTLPAAASRVSWGLPFPAHGETLTMEAGGDNGPARHKMARISRAWIEVIGGRGLYFGDPARPQALEQPRPRDSADQRWVPEDNCRFIERAGDNTRFPRLRWERRRPFQSTIAGIGCEIEVRA